VVAEQKSLRSPAVAELRWPRTSNFCVAVGFLRRFECLVSQWAWPDIRRVCRLGQSVLFDQLFTALSDLRGRSFMDHLFSCVPYRCTQLLCK